MLDRGDTIRGGISLDTPDRRTDRYGYHSSSSSMRHHHHHHRHHPYRRNEYFPEEFKNIKLPTFHGEMKKSEDTKAWFLGMKKFFKLYNYSENHESQHSYLQSQRERRHLVGRFEECQGRLRIIFDFG